MTACYVLNSMHVTFLSSQHPSQLSQVLLAVHETMIALTILHVRMINASTHVQLVTHVLHWQHAKSLDTSQCAPVQMDTLALLK